MVYRKPKGMKTLKYNGLEFIIDFLGMEKSDFAEHLGVSKQQLNSWLKGSRPIPKKWIQVLSEKYKLDGEIFTNELNQAEILKLYEHLLVVNKVEPEKINKAVEVMKLGNKRAELHESNIERLGSLLLTLHYGVIQSVGEDDPNLADKVTYISDQFIERVDNFLQLNENYDHEKIMILDWILDYLINTDKVDIDEMVRLMKD